MFQRAEPDEPGFGVMIVTPLPAEVSSKSLKTCLFGCSRIEKPTRFKFVELAASELAPQPVSAIRAAATPAARARPRRRPHPRVTACLLVMRVLLQISPS